jgi:hypothetical protein
LRRLFRLLKFICRSYKWISVKKVWRTKYERRIVILKERYLEEYNLSRGKKSCSSGNERRVQQTLFWSNENDIQFIIFPSVFQTQNRSRCDVRQFFLRQLKWFYFDSFLIYFDSQLVEVRINRTKTGQHLSSINSYFDSISRTKH